MNKPDSKTGGTPQTSLPLQTLIDARYQLPRSLNSQKQGRSEFPGQRISRQRGQGLEFTDLRQYTTGDDIRHIDWNVTARTNEPYTRLYREEREHATTVVVDFRPSMFSGSQCLRAVTAGQLAASVLWHACESGDRCSASVVSRFGQKVSRPLAGQRGALQACELIATEFQAASRKTEHTDPPLSPFLDSINTANRLGGSYIVFSGFDTDSDAQWAQQLGVTGATGRMTAVMLIDPLEVTGLPGGTYPFKTATHKTGAARSVAQINQSNRQFFKQRINQSIENQIDLFERSNVPLHIHNTSHNNNLVLQALQQRALL